MRFDWCLNKINRLLLGPSINNQTLQNSRKFFKVSRRSFLDVNILVTSAFQQLVLMIITNKIIVNRYRKFQSKMHVKFRRYRFLKMRTTAGFAAIAKMTKSNVNWSSSLDVNICLIVWPRNFSLSVYVKRTIENILWKFGIYCTWSFKDIDA